MSLEEIMVQILANRKNRMNELKVRATMDHQLASLMAYAMNDPSKMPKLEEAYPFLKEQQVQNNQVEHVPEWKINQMKMMARAKQIKNNREKIAERSE
ncbi:hypothetical protein QS460_00755 [Liquorilactobacillus mali]|uniref:hypothetical protein n=1 Tax=Liquorilactobacillus mali TaxID=1618 RepID=UPI00264C066C|nr:hypothetical protein [Liquorilactobacillus mali]MDN7144447.1 hypothetical protein [Liquorilactobacillus mali]